MIRTAIQIDEEYATAAAYALTHAMKAPSK